MEALFPLRPDVLKVIESFGFSLNEIQIRFRALRKDHGKHRHPIVAYHRLLLGAEKKMKSGMVPRSRNDSDYVSQRSLSQHQEVNSQSECSPPSCSPSQAWGRPHEPQLSYPPQDHNPMLPSPFVSIFQTNVPVSQPISRGAWQTAAQYAPVPPNPCYQNYVCDFNNSITNRAHGYVEAPCTDMAAIEFNNLPKAVRYPDDIEQFATCKTLPATSIAQWSLMTDHEIRLLISVVDHALANQGVAYCKKGMYVYSCQRLGMRWEIQIHSLVAGGSLCLQIVQMQGPGTLKVNIYRILKASVVNVFHT
jgi:hypothetical protein